MSIAVVYHVAYSPKVMPIYHEMFTRSDFGAGSSTREDLYLFAESISAVFQSRHVYPQSRPAHCIYS
jgi:hypothetical protein